MDKGFDPTAASDNEETALPACVEPGEENISESFVCCVCLDLLYKPVVLACGHVSCFWCVHLSMNGHGDSTCPICRHPYHHFPTICQMLHFLIVKIYPIAYERRDKQTLGCVCFSGSSFIYPYLNGMVSKEKPDLQSLYSSALHWVGEIEKEEEKKMGSFSPQFEGSSMKSNSIGGSELSSVSFPKPELSAETSEFNNQSQDDKTENDQAQKNADGTLNQVSITDVLCPSCKQLLFRPAVLNCGHAYCETCIAIPEDGTITCQVCESRHPCDFPKACLEWNNFLEETFPKEYASRRDSVEPKQVDRQQKIPPACSSSAKSGISASSSYFSADDLVSWLTEHGPMVHFGAGCDHCGVLPIVGHRYRCKDCKEAIGFDLCADCYKSNSKLPGRFNQQHTADHNFELIKTSHTARGLLLRLATGSLSDGSIHISADATEPSEEDGSAMTASANSPQQNADDSDAVDSAETNDNPSEN